MESILENFFVNTVVYSFWIAVVSFILEFYIVYNFSVHQEHLRRQMLLMKLEDFSRIIHEIKQFAFQLSRESELKMRINNIKKNSMKKNKDTDRISNLKSLGKDFSDSVSPVQDSGLLERNDKEKIIAIENNSLNEPNLSHNYFEPTNSINTQSDLYFQDKYEDIFLCGSIESKFTKELSKICFKNKLITREETLKEIIQLWEKFENEIHKVVLELREPMRNARKIFLFVIAFGWILGSGIIIFEVVSRFNYISIYSLFQKCLVWILPGTIIYLPVFYFLRKATYHKLKLV